MSTKIDIDIADLEKELRAPFCASATTPIASGVLKDGRKYQIQVIITTDEDEFIEPQTTTNAQDK